MAPRKSSEISRQTKNLTTEEQRSAIERLQRRIREIRSLDISAIQKGTDSAVTGLEESIRATLASIYGDNSEQYNRLIPASVLDRTTYSVDAFYNGGSSIAEIREGIERGRQLAIATLEGEVNALKEHLEFLPSNSVVTSSSDEKVAPIASKDIFIVHGRDEAAKAIVARVVERAGLKPIILHEQPNGGKTLIEKFEQHGNAAGFAIAILPPDDVGGPAVIPPAVPALDPRARQNVIGEMFWFAGKLGRNRVCALRKGDTEIPSDFAGLVYTPMDDSGGWKSKLLQELDAAGYADLNWRAALS